MSRGLNGDTMKITDKNSSRVGASTVDVRRGHADGLGTEPADGGSV